VFAWHLGSKTAGNVVRDQHSGEMNYSEGGGSKTPAFSEAIGFSGRKELQEHYLVRTSRGPVYGGKVGQTLHQRGLLLLEEARGLKKRAHELNARMRRRAARRAPSWVKWTGAKR